MATTIVTKFGSDAPAATDIVRGELAVDTENGRLYTENAAGAVVELGLNPEGASTFAGKITADAGIDIDNINIDGTTIALSSGDLTLDVAGDIILDADGSEIIFADGGTSFGKVQNSSSSMIIESVVSDKDILFYGNDGGSSVLALTLDMSNAGAATFNSGVTSGAHLINAESTAFGASSVQGFNTDFLVDTGQGYARHNSYHTGGSNHQFLVNEASSTTNAVAFSIAKDKSATFNSSVTATGALFSGTSPLDVRMGTDKRIFFSGGIGEIGDVAGFQSLNTAGNALAGFGIRASSIALATSSNTRLLLSDNGAITATPSAGGHAVFNEAGVNADFRVESDSQANAFVVDGGNNSVTFGKATDGLTLAGGGFSNLQSGGHVYFHVTNTETDANSGVMYINRQSSDGTLVQFRQANSPEGSIEVSGATVSYDGFAGRHESSGILTTTAKGTVVSTIDELDEYLSGPKQGQTRADHAKVKMSDTVGDARVYGVVDNFTDEGKVNVISVGIGSIKVTGACAGGDLLESNGDGTAKVQADDIIRSKTIGKVTIGDSNTGVKLVSCVLYCG